MPFTGYRALILVGLIFFSSHPISIGMGCGMAAARGRSVAALCSRTEVLFLRLIALTGYQEIQTVIAVSCRP